MHALPTSLRAAVQSGRIETKNYDWKSNLEGLRSTSERAKAARSLLWLLRDRIARRMKRQVSRKGSSDPYNLPMKRIRVLLDRETLIKAYVESMTAGASSGDQVSRKPSTNLLPDAVENALANGRLIEDGWLTRTVSTLDHDQQRRLVKKAITMLSSQTGYHSSLLSMKYQRRKILARINDAQALYKQLQLHRTDPIGPIKLRRIRNPFTRISHSSYEEELREILRWQSKEQEVFNRLFKVLKFDAGLSQNKRNNLQEECNTSSLKLRAVKRYIAKLELEKVPTTKLLQGEGQEYDDVDTKASLDYTPKEITIPYRAQHHVLKDVFDRFKVALFEVGRRLIPEIMQREGWAAPEGLSIKEFGDIVLQHRSMRIIYRLYEKQWQSLRIIRNTYAHETPNLDFYLVEELLDDVKDLAYVLECHDMEALIEKYQHLLVKYKEEYLDFASDHYKNLEEELNSIEDERGVALKDLAATEHKEDEEQQRHIDDKFNEMRLDLVSRYQRRNRDKQNVLTRDLVNYALASQIRHSLDSGDTAWAADVTKSLSKEYAASAERKLERELVGLQEIDRPETLESHAEKDTQT